MSGGSASQLAERSLGGSVPHRLELEEWRREYGVIAGITGADDGFDLGLWGPKPGGDTMRMWKSFQDSFTPHFRQFVVSHQQHGRLVGRSNGAHEGLVVSEGLDGHATTDRGILLTVLVADCVPVYLFDPKSGALALLHAGWRGVAAGILEAGIEQLESVGVSGRKDIVMHCGVSICGSCYEVGVEVIEAVLGEHRNTAGTLDIRNALAEQAAKLGMRKVTVSPLCTVHDSRLFHSFRTSGDEAGRMAAYLGMPLA